MKKLPLIAMAAGFVVWAMTRGKKRGEEMAPPHAEPTMAGVPDTSPSGG